MRDTSKNEKIEDCREMREGIRNEGGHTSSYLYRSARRGRD
jgi:hypothetical protein